MIKKPIYTFKDVTDTGIDKVPNNSTVFIKDNGLGTSKQILLLVKDAGWDDTTPISTVLSATTRWQSSLDEGLPIGGIVMYSGTLTELPLNWKLCDGSSGTPDLRGQFIYGASDQASIGNTGGSNDAIVVTHDHTSASHSHTMNQHDHTMSHTHNHSHTHGMGTHDHTSASHSHTMNQHDHTSAAHSHTMGTHLHSVTHDHGAFNSAGAGAHDHGIASAAKLWISATGDGLATGAGGITDTFYPATDHVHSINVPSVTVNTVAVDPGDTNSTTPNSTGSTDPGDTNATTPNKVGATDPGDTNSQSSTNTGASSESNTGSKDPGDTNSTTPNNTGSSGSNGSNENMPAYIILAYIMRIS